MQDSASLSKQEHETGTVLAPKFNADGLVPAITQHAETGEVLMLAYMNAEALKATIETKRATYFSRSRNAIWIKGETSGQTQIVEEIRIDCDQDTILLKVVPQGDGGCCHVGYRQCFFRTVESVDTLAEAED